MHVQPLTQDKFKEETGKPGIVLIDFWANWCTPCKVFKPIFEKAAEANPDIRFFSVDTEAESDLTALFGIHAIPTLMVFRDGLGVFQQAGALPEKGLTTLINAVKSLDMEKVRSQWEEEKRQQAASMVLPIMFFGLGKGSFKETTLDVHHIAEYPRGADGTCALCHGDPCDEKKEPGSMIGKFYQENPEAGTCPVCHGRPA